MKEDKEFKHCSFFKVSSKRRLAGLLGVSLPELFNLKEAPTYRVFSKMGKGKYRTFEHPVGSLLLVQKKVHKILRSISLPEWVFSGRRGFSHIDNGRYHAQPRIAVLKMDIKNFFPSCKEKFVFRFLKRDLQMSDDCAYLLSKLLTKDGHLPIGSPSSQILAFWSYNQCFKNIHDYAENINIKMSLFVDDVAFSCEDSFPKGFSYTISCMVKEYGLSIKRTKTTRYGPKSFKKITGCAISPEGSLEIPNSLLLKIRKTRKKLPEKKGICRLNGLLAAAKQIDSSYTLKK